MCKGVTYENHKTNTPSHTLYTHHTSCGGVGKEGGEMNTKYVTSLELSKQLKEAGIPQESDWYWSNIYPEKGWELISKETLLARVPGEEWTYLDEGLSKEVVYSAFHLGELGEMLPSEVQKNGISYSFWESRAKINDFWINYIYYPEIGKPPITLMDHDHSINTEAEARGKMLLYLKKEGLI